MRGGMMLAIAVSLAGCGPDAVAPRGEETIAPPGPAAVETATGAPGTAPAVVGRFATHVTDPAVLAPIAADRGNLGRVLGGDLAATTRELAAGGWGRIATTLTEDVRSTGRADPRAGVGIRGNPHRLFDVRWLRSEMTRFELIAVVNRLDRRPFQPEACGETRLVYRLAYTTDVQGEPVSSRLPMTVNVELKAAPPDGEGGCRDAAERWRVPSDLEGEALGERLLSQSGPLTADLLRPDRIAQVVVNLQSVRWPSTIRPDMAGHAEYVLRAFDRGGAPRPLENTPDVARLRRDRRALAELTAWIREPDNLAAVDAGTAQIPETFLGRMSTSVTPLGLSRLANRPFRQLLDPDAFADLDYSGLRHVKSAEGLVRRLDDMTCAGCHQSRAVAGFHMLGEDGADVVAGNALAVPFSPHVARELVRRALIHQRVLSEANVDWSRDFAERGGTDDSGYGARCGLGDAGFAHWTCADGFVCVDYDTPSDDPGTVGTCLPEEAGLIGDPCEVGRVRANRNPHRDRVAREDLVCGAGFRCNDNRVGFPGGMCAGSCRDVGEDGTCGVIAVLGPFNACLGRGTPFPRCLAETVRPSGLRACSAATPCRDDYICARTPSGEGACLPPYFLFQLRVDGHPSG